jgi:hypothetical protein
MLDDKNLILPWEQKSNTFFTVDTLIKQSTISNAGNGRFANQDIKVGDIIRKDPIISVEDFVDKNQFGCIQIKNYNELDKLKKYFESSNKPDICKYMGWFIFGINNILFVYSNSYFTNHSDNNNKTKNIFKKTYLKPYNLSICTTEIKKGEELFWDYNNMGQFPDFYLEWCKHNQVINMLNIVKSL